MSIDQLRTSTDLPPYDQTKVSPKKLRNSLSGRNAKKIEKPVSPQANLIFSLNEDTSKIRERKSTILPQKKPPAKLNLSKSADELTTRKTDQEILIPVQSPDRIIAQKTDHKRKNQSLSLAGVEDFRKCIRFFYGKPLTIEMQDSIQEIRIAIFKLYEELLNDLKQDSEIKEIDKFLETAQNKDLSIKKNAIKTLRQIDEFLSMLPPTQKSKYEHKLKNLFCAINRLIDEYIDKDKKIEKHNSPYHIILSNFADIKRFVKHCEQIVSNWQDQCIHEEIFLSTIEPKDYKEISHKFKNKKINEFALDVETELKDLIKCFLEVTQIICTLPELKNRDELFIATEESPLSPYMALHNYMIIFRKFLDCTYLKCTFGKNKKNILDNHLKICLTKLNIILINYKKIIEQRFILNLPTNLLHEQCVAFSDLIVLVPLSKNHKTHTDQAVLSMVKWLTKDSSGKVPNTLKNVKETILWQTKLAEGQIHQNLFEDDQKYSNSDVANKKLFIKLNGFRLTTEADMKQLLTNINEGRFSIKVENDEWIRLKISDDQEKNQVKQNFITSLENFFKVEERSLKPNTSPFDVTNNHLHKLYMLCMDNPHLVNAIVVSGETEKEYLLREMIFEVDPYLPIIMDIVNNYGSLINTRKHNSLPFEFLQIDQNNWKSLLDLTKTRIEKIKKGNIIN